jgi:O-antigen/teichoic acid export membrane protein
LAAIVVPVSGIGFIMLYGTKALQSLREEAIVSNVLRPIARILFVGVALLIVASELSAFVGLTVAEITITFASILALRRRLPILGQTEAIDYRSMVRFALPAWGTRIVESLRKQVFPIMLGALASLSAVGIFVTTQRIALALAVLIGTIEQIYSPMAATLFLGDRHHELAMLFQSMAKVSFAVAFPLFCLEVGFSEQILGLFGSEFREAQTVLILLATAMLFNFGTGPVTPTLIISGRSRTALVTYILVLVTELGLGLWLVPRIGVVGAAIARLGGAVLLNCLNLIVVWRRLRLQPYRLDFWKPAAAGVIAVAVARLTVVATGVTADVPSLVLGSLILGTTYLALLAAFRLSEEDRTVVKAALSVVLRTDRVATSRSGT